MMKHMYIYRFLLILIQKWNSFICIKTKHDNELMIICIITLIYSYKSFFILYF